MLLLPPYNEERDVVPGRDASEDDLELYEAIGGCVHQHVRVIPGTWDIPIDRHRSEEVSCEIVVCDDCKGDFLYRLAQEPAPSHSAIQIARARIQRYSQDRLLALNLRRKLEVAGWEITLKRASSGILAQGVKARTTIETEPCASDEIAITRLTVQFLNKRFVQEAELELR